MIRIFRPDTISHATRNDPRFRAEIQVFDRIQKEVEDWKEDLCVYHNCDFVTDRLGDGEIDFILVFNRGVAFVEIKGGRIKYDSTSDTWSSINRENEVFRIKDPAKQALKAEKSYLRLFKEDSSLKECWINTQHFVCFPDISSPAKDLSPKLPNKITLYREDVKSGFLKRINNVFGSKKKISNLDESTIQNIDRLIKPSFAINPSWLTDLENESEAMQLSGGQKAILKILRNHKRVFIEGCAGTGKTLMAVQRAKEFSQQGKKVLILTHSRTLPIDLRKKYFNNEKFNDLYISSAFPLTSRLARNKRYDFDKLHSQYPDKEERFNVGYPNLLMEVMEAGDQYDAVIVDEGQRFTDEWLLAIEGLKKKNGYLYVFYDPNQVLKNSEMSDFLEGEQPYILDENFRNTQKIFNFSKNLYKGFDITSAGPAGRDVESIVINSIEDQNVAIVRKIKQFVSEGIPLDDIAIINFGPVAEKGGLQKKLQEALVTDPPFFSVGASRFSRVSKNLLKHVLVDGLESRTRDPYVRYDSVARYQGLEFPIVIFTNFTRNIDEKSPNDLYIGLTRSNNHLILIGTASNFKDIKRLTSVDFDCSTTPSTTPAKEQQVYTGDIPVDEDIPLAAKGGRTYCSGKWLFSPDEAEAMIGGIIFFHNVKRESSYEGGQVLAFKLVDYYGKTRVEFKFQSSDEAKGIAWEGNMEKRAWSSGILTDANGNKKLHLICRDRKLIEPC